MKKEIIHIRYLTIMRIYFLVSWEKFHEIFYSNHNQRISCQYAESPLEVHFLLHVHIYIYMFAWLTRGGTIYTYHVDDESRIEDEDDGILGVQEAIFFQSTPFRETVYWLCAFCTLGLSHLILSSMPNWQAFFRYTLAKDALSAGRVKIPRRCQSLQFPLSVPCPLIPFFFFLWVLVTDPSEAIPQNASLSSKPWRMYNQQ